MKIKAVNTFFCKSVLAGFLWFFCSQHASAQAVTNYTFTGTTGTFTALSAPTNPTLSAGDVDEGYFNNIPIGFDFWYMGTRYTTISAGTNGWLTLGADITDPSYPKDLPNGGTPRPVIAPLWDDLNLQVATNLSYLVAGSSPNRIFTIQYLNTKWNYTATGNSISFQAKLYEGTGKIEFVYRPEAGALVSASAHIGITATASGSGNFLSVNNAGTSVNSTTSQNVTSKPVSGKTYSFISPLPTTPGSLTFTSVNNSAMTLNWTDLSSNERGFVIYKSTDGINYTIVSQVAAGSTSSAQSGLSESSTYYWKVVAVSEGRLSSALSGSQATTALILSWYNSAWQYRKAITIDYTKVGAGPHSNFPVLISGADGDLQTKAQTDADDILFTYADGSTKLDHQVESYTSASGTIVAWVELPNVSSTANTVIYMYYGNAAAAAQQNITGTWDATFKGVWHLNSIFTDATSNANDGTNTGTIAATGKIAGGSGFVRSDGTDYITVAGKMGSPTSFTLSAWANVTTADVNAAEIISIADNAIMRYDVSNSKVNGVYYNGTSWDFTLSSTNYASGWHYIVYTFDDAGNSQQIFIDGQPDGAATTFTASPNYTGGTNTFIGTHGNGNINMDFDGTIDEARVSNASRSAGWVLTEYNNQNSPLTFYSVGVQTCNSPTTSAAGADQTSGATCGLTTVTLAANTPSVGTGAWSIISGAGGTVNTPASATSTFSGISGTAYTLRWTISNSPCTASTDDVAIFFTPSPSATISYAGSPYYVSGGTASVTFSGTTGGTYSSTAGLSINATTGAVTLGTSTPAAYTVTYTVAAAGGCSLYTTTAGITVINSPKTWDGGAGTNNWGDAANWNTDGIPASTDDVDLSGANTININVAATTKNLLLNNAGLVLTINSGNSLVVSGNLTLTNGTINTAAAFATVSGTVNVAGGTVGFTGSISQTIPAYNYNDLKSSSTGGRTLAGSGTIGIAGTFTPGTNTYTITGSTINYNAAGAQTIAAFNYNNLALSNSGTKTFASGTSCIASTLSITGSATANATANSSTISYNGSTTQTITALTYYGLNVSSTGGTVTGLNTTVTNFSINSGTVDLNTNTLTITGTANYTSGTINNGTVTSTGATTTFGGTVFGAIVNATSDNVALNGSVFNSTATLTKNGSTTITSNGGNTFNSTVTISNSGSADLILANLSPDIFNGSTTFTNTGTAALNIAYNSSGNQFNGNVTFNNTGTGSTIRSSYGAIATAFYNGNIVVNNTSAVGIYFGNLGGTTTLAATKTITKGGTGFTTGVLLLRYFTQLSSTAQAFTLTGTALLQMGPSAIFNGNVNFISPQLLLNGVTFNGAALLTKSGVSDNASTGGNIFNGVTTLVCSGTGSLDLGNTSPETFNTNLTINNTGGGRIQIGINSAGNLFNGNVIINHGGNTGGLNTVIARNTGSTATFNGNLTLNCTNLNATSGIVISNDAVVNINGNITLSSTNGRGIIFGAASGSVTLANGFTIADSSFTTGTLTLSKFTQTGGTAQHIALTGTANLLLGPSSVFNGPVNFSAPQLFLNGCQCNNTAVLTKNGATDNTSTGGNIFNAATTITNSGTGFLRLSNTIADDFNSDATFIQTGSGSLQPAYAMHYTIAGNLSTAGTTTAITFGTATAAVTLDGTGAQSITGSLTPIFNNLVISNTGNTVTSGVQVSIAGNLSVTSGTFDLGGYTANRLTAGGILTVSNGATLKIGSTNSIPSNYSTHSIGASSTIAYSGTNQSVVVLNSAQNYGHLLVSGTGTAINSGNITVRGNLSVTSGSLNINTYVLKIGGSIATGGTFYAGNGTIEMNGSSAQTIPASTFSGNAVKHLTINNAAGVTLGGTLHLSGILLASAGQFNAGSYLTLLSTVTQTALIDGSGAGNVSGNVTMQRYLPSGFGYKYVSSPFQAATVNEFSGDLDLGAAFPSFYRYDENLLSSGWVRYTGTSGMLYPGEGYTANFGPSFSPKTIEITGIVNNGTVSTTLYNHNRIFTQGFNLVGNPYPSPIDWDAVSGWTKTNIDNAVYYFNNGITDQYTGTYSSYINGISSDGTAGNVIAAAQGFFVHVSNGAFPVSATLSFNNNTRINNLVPDFRRRLSLTLPLVRISAGFMDQNTTQDPLVIYFDDEDATPAFDKEMDAYKLMNTDVQVPNFYAITTDREKLSIGAWPGLKVKTDTIPLGLVTKQAGPVIFNATSIDRLPYGQHIYLHDSKTGLSQDLQSNPEYRLHLEAGKYENRFFLTMGPKETGLVNTIADESFIMYSLGGKLFVNGNLAPGDKGNVKVVNMLGQIMCRQVISGTGYQMVNSHFAPGVYLVNMATTKGMLTKKILIKY